MYRRILVPLDNTAADATILEHIRPLARLLKSSLLLTHVADGHVARNQAPLNLEDSEEMRVDRDYLARRQGELAAEGFEVATRLLCGEPAHQIVQLAEQEQCDLIAMATHGHRLLQDVVLGSVASEVRHRTLIPVLLVRRRP